jgi:penicillin-binding protein 1A
MAKNKKKKKKNGGKQKKVAAVLKVEAGKEKPQNPRKKEKNVSAKKKDIELKEKIELEKSAHSYRSFFYRRYGKYINRAKKPVSIFIKAAIYVLVFFFGFVALLFLVFGRDLPDVGKLKGMNFAETTRIYDRNGNLLYSIFDEENRKYVSLNYIAPVAVDATLSIEDKNFYNHWGFDLVGIIRAQMANIKDDSMSQGASTITQQLAKNIFLSPEKTYQRKIKELLLSLEIEWAYSKNEILEMYLNKISYGSNSYGIEAASVTFFGKTSKDLTIIESAILASLPKAPSYFSPYGQHKDELMGFCKSGKTIETAGTSMELIDNEEALAEDPNFVNPEETSSTQEIVAEATETKPSCASIDDPSYVWGRKDFVLKRMLDDNYITKQQMDAAWKEGLTQKFLDPVHKIEAPHFVFYVKELMEKKYGKEIVENGGLEIRTSLDPYLQSVAEETVVKNAPHNKTYYNANNAGLIAIDPRTGEILAMVGSVDYWDNSIDGQVNVTASLRQPGSSFKPLVYAAAIENAHIGSGTILSDYKTVFNKKDVPRNSDNTYKGKMRVRDALNQSRNIPAIKAYYLAGEEDKLLDFLDKIGLGNLRQFKNDFNKDSASRGWTFNFGWPMAIGSGEVRLIDLAGAYGTLANGGKYVATNPILEVRDRKGNILEKFDPNIINGTQSINAQAAYIVSNMLSDSMAKPAGTWRASMTIPGHTVAAKTGTSNKKVGRGIYPNNNILMGYTPSLVVGVWVGNTDGRQMRGNAWAFLDCGPMWKDFFLAALKDKPDEPFPEPPGIKRIGKEVYPSDADYRTNFDARFKKIGTQEETQETVKDTQQIVDIDSGGWINDGFGAPSTAVDTKTPVEPAAPPVTETPVTPLVPEYTF